MGLTDEDLARLGGARGRLGDERSRAADHLCGLNVEKQEIEATIADMNRVYTMHNYQIDLLNRVELLYAPFHKPMMRLRETYQTLLKGCDRRDITVDQVDELRKAAQDARTQLQAACFHPLVLFKNPYIDDYPEPYSSSMDEKGVHGCVICGLIVIDDDYKGANKQFRDDGNRLMRRLFFDLSENGEHSKISLRARIHDYYMKLTDMDELRRSFFNKGEMTLVEEIVRQGEEG